jgi:hypothetical protein
MKVSTVSPKFWLDVLFIRLCHLLVITFSGYSIFQLLHLPV